MMELLSEIGLQVPGMTEHQNKGQGEIRMRRLEITEEYITEHARLIGANPDEKPNEIRLMIDKEGGGIFLP